MILPAAQGVPAQGKGQDAGTRYLYLLNARHPNDPPRSSAPWQQSENNRREFLKAGGAALAATAVALNAKSYAQVMGANDRVRVGIVGCGDRMKGGDLPAFQQNAKDMNFQIVAVSDIWKMRREQGVDFIEKLCGNRPDQVRNNDELYARKDVDAVIIATADFQHAYHGAEAVEAGRDAYVEKPTAHTMADARRILAAVKKSGKIVQVGTQRRSTPAYHEGRRVHQVGPVRRHRDGGDDVEREPARPLAPSRRGAAAQGRRHGLEALFARQESGAVRRAQVS